MAAAADAGWHQHHRGSDEQRGAAGGHVLPAGRVVPAAVHEEAVAHVVWQAGLCFQQHVQLLQPAATHDQRRWAAVSQLAHAAGQLPAAACQCILIKM